MHYFVTGHTGFKGAWLTLMLDYLGHTVTGYALDPAPGSLFERAQLGDVVLRDTRGDIRDADAVRRALRSATPDVVLHLAAQPLVRESYREPRATVETNLMGTLNVLEAVRETPSVKAHVVATTDKVYRNDESGRPFREGDPLGGADPYSASKAMVEHLVASWVHSFDLCPTATVRAGNVIGGGDISRDRLLPDLMSSFARGKTARVRNPGSVRPWQHVLDALNGYVALVEAMVRKEPVPASLNIGPTESDSLTVGGVADLAAEIWGQRAIWSSNEGMHQAEAGCLALDSHLARSLLEWRPRLDAKQAVCWTIEWTKAALEGASPVGLSRDQVARFRELE
jgi:CDP-glucose 4,6-dehydratase